MIDLPITRYGIFEYSMGKASLEVRRYIAQRAELLGDVRFSDNTFRANASTEVTGDILILQKRGQEKGRRWRGADVVFYIGNIFASRYDKIFNREMMR